MTSREAFQKSADYSALASYLEGQLKKLDERIQEGKKIENEIHARMQKEPDSAEGKIKTTLEEKAEIHHLHGEQIYQNCLSAQTSISSGKNEANNQAVHWIQVAEKLRRQEEEERRLREEAERRLRESVEKKR